MTDCPITITPPDAINHLQVIYLAIKSLQKGSSEEQKELLQNVASIVQDTIIDIMEKDFDKLSKIYNINLKKPI